MRLSRADQVPAGMVHVEGGRYRLAGWSRAVEQQVELSDYHVDRYEVSNSEFEAFVRAGGYRNRALWRHPFEDNGRTLTFDKSMTRLRDTTGLPGPRNWIGGAPPPGRENHPVTHVTWYEAAAFAAWKGKLLPSVFQWEKAARPRTGAVGTTFPWGVVVEGCPLAIFGAGGGPGVTDRANFASAGTVPVDSMPFGMSPWGAYHMAGNVAEWCSNPIGSGFSARGGGWNNAFYSFGRTASLPSWFTSDELGFRCVSAEDPREDQGSFPLESQLKVPQYIPVDDQTFEEIRRRFDYPRLPLQVHVVETLETSAWRREKLTYLVDGKTVPAYLYIPKGVSPPFQIIHFSPSGDVVTGFRPLDASIESSLAPYIRGGRAVFSVVMEGFGGRPRTSERSDLRSPEYVDHVITQVTELRRGLDVLETRKDLDVTRIAFLAPSAGASAGVILAGLEQRYRAVTFVGTRISPDEVSHAPAANRINFAPRIEAPTLMLQGRYDESAPLTTHAEPLFRLLREPKALEVYEGSHVPSDEISVPITMKWLDKRLGPVGR